MNYYHYIKHFRKKHPVISLYNACTRGNQLVCLLLVMLFSIFYIHTIFIFILQHDAATKDETQAVCAKCFDYVSVSDNTQSTTITHIIIIPKIVFNANVVLFTRECTHCFVRAAELVTTELNELFFLTFLITFLSSIIHNQARVKTKLGNY